MSIVSAWRAALAAALVVPSLLGAQDKPRPREITADLGFVSTGGNSRVSTFNFGERFIARRGPWVHTQRFGSVYGSQDGKQTSDLLFANWRSDIAIGPQLAVFGYAAFDRNRFAGIGRRFEESLGLAAKLLRRDTDSWTMDVGLGANQQRSTSDSTLRFASLRSATAYRHQFSKASHFQQTVEYLPSFKLREDYRILSESAFTAPVATHLSLKLGYVLRYDNLPEAGKGGSDRVFTSGLQFSW